MPRMVLLPLNSCEVKASPDSCRCGGHWRSWTTMALRVLVLITLLLLADAQKWPVNGDCQPCQCSYKTTSFGKMRTVNCSSRGLSSIPASLPDDLMALDLSWNVLDVEQLRQHLCKFPSLQLVSLSFADLTTLSDILKECSSVLELNLTGNRLDQVDSKTFMGLKNLRRLLGLEMESVVARDIFKHLTNLKDLDVIFHGPALPKGLFDDLGIQSLNLVVTQAASLPLRVFEFGQKTLNTLQLIGERVTQLEEDLLDGLFVLKKLYLVMPSVQQLPERIFHSQQLQPGDSRTKVANLQEVEISGIQGLPAMLFNNLVTLETLQLKEIGSFPQMGFLAGVINLRTLLVTGSELPSIPEGWFRQLYSLETLILSGLQLERLDENAFRGLISLTYLDLSDNKLDEITAKMLMPLNKTLETLILRGNLLTQVNKDVLGKLGTLRLLDVGENRLTNVHTNSFMGMTYLSFLYLNNNRLTSLPQDLFKGLLQVQSLSLSENYLVESPKAILQLNRSLISLDMASNELHEVPAFQMCQFMYLERINIMGNYLHCDCPLLAFHQCKQISVEGQCKSPPDYLDMYVNDIKVPSSCAEENRAKQMSDRQTEVMRTTVEMPESTQQNSSVMSSTATSDQEASGNQFTQNVTIVRKLFTEKLTNQSTNENDTLLSSRQTAEVGSHESQTIQHSRSNDQDTEDSNKESQTSKKENPIESNRETTDGYLQTNSVDSSQQPSGEDAKSIHQSSAGNSGNISTQKMAGLSPGKDTKPSKSAKNSSIVGEGLSLDVEQKDVIQETIKPDIENTQDQMMGDSPSQGIIADQISEEQLSQVSTESTGGEENPVSDEKNDSVWAIIASVISSTTPLGFEESMENKMKYSTTSTPISVSSSAEIEPVNNESYEGPNGGTKDDEDPEKAAFNFIISAVVALSISGCVVLGIIFVRQWQQKGSYRINEDAEMNNLDSEEAAAIFPKDKVEAV